MALIEISETQLAFGYLHSYMNVYRPRRFILPSIRQEGGMVRFPYPSADIIIDNNHLIQFKRPYFFITNGIKEFRNYSQPSNTNPPYFRFHIKNDDPTNQLSSLVRATKSGLSAEYISPLFTDEGEFFNLIRNNRRHLEAYAHIDIAQFSGMLGAIGNNNDHTIIYNQETVNNGICYCFSEPKKIKAERFEENSNIKGQGQTFNAFEIVKLIRSLFFQEEDISFQSDNAIYQCRVLQNRLFVQRDIIWHFNFRIIK
jgi:hypothetical protein